MTYRAFFVVVLIFLPLICRGESSEKQIKAFETAHVVAEIWTVEQTMAHYNVPGLSIALIKGGKVAWAKAYGVSLAGKEGKVDTDTMFSVGSTSKVAAAAITLRLVDAGMLDLDRNVNDYLTSWKVPENKFTKKEPVTLRRLMSHTAGTTVHGFKDFKFGQALPTIVQTLDGTCPCPLRSNGSEREGKPVRVEWLPGSRQQYSGGGITIEQLVIEDVTGLSFPAAARKYLFDPLGMTRSSFENPLPDSWGNKARAHDEDGVYDGYEVMPEMAASGLWTTPSDYSKMIIAFIKSYKGERNSFLSRSLARDLMTRVKNSEFGLGPVLDLDKKGETRRFRHDGANDFYRAKMEGYLATGDGVVIYTNGVQGTALYKAIYGTLARVEGWVERTLSPLQQQQNTQLTLGDKQLALGNAQKALKHFLSAVFYKNPKREAFVLHELARAYEALGQTRRAYVNYQRAASKGSRLAPQMRANAKASMARLLPSLAADDPLLKDK